MIEAIVLGVTLVIVVLVLCYTAARIMTDACYIRDLELVEHNWGALRELIRSRGGPQTIFLEVIGRDLLVEYWAKGYLFSQTFYFYEAQKFAIWYEVMNSPEMLFSEGLIGNNLLYWKPLERFLSEAGLDRPLKLNKPS